MLQARKRGWRGSWAGVQEKKAPCSKAEVRPPRQEGQGEESGVGLRERQVLRSSGMTTELSIKEGNSTTLKGLLLKSLP